MSWMDSWSRPKKDQAVPAPYYLTQPDTKYCHTCGRVIGSRRTNHAKAKENIVKYCSDRCKRHKPSTTDDSIESRLEHALAELLEGRTVMPPTPDGHDVEAAPVRAKYQPVKGDPRIIIQISELEEAVFGNRVDPEKTFGRRRNRARRYVPDGRDWKSVDMLDDASNNERRRAENLDDDDEEWSDGPAGSAEDDESFQTNGVSLRIRPSQSKSDVNFSVGGERGWAEKIEETPEMEQKRLEGVKRAEEKEMVKQAARRAVVFGLPRPPDRQSLHHKIKGRKKKGGRAVDEDENEAGSAMKKCEALMSGSVVEPSFAKGDWSVRWREE